MERRNKPAIFPLSLAIEQDKGFPIRFASDDATADLGDAGYIFQDGSRRFHMLQRSINACGIHRAISQGKPLAIPR